MWLSLHQARLQIRLSTRRSVPKSEMSPVKPAPTVLDFRTSLLHASRISLLPASVGKLPIAFGSAQSRSMSRMVDRHFCISYTLYDVKLLDVVEDLPSTSSSSPAASESQDDCHIRQYLRAVDIEQAFEQQKVRSRGIEVVQLRSSLRLYDPSPLPAFPSFCIFISRLGVARYPDHHHEMQEARFDQQGSTMVYADEAHAMHGCTVYTVHRYDERPGSVDLLAYRKSSLRHVAKSLLRVHPSYSISSHGGCAFIVDVMGMQQEPRSRDREDQLGVGPGPAAWISHLEHDRSVLKCDQHTRQEQPWPVSPRQLAGPIQSQRSNTMIRAISKQRQRLSFADLFPVQGLLFEMAKSTGTSTSYASAVPGYSSLLDLTSLARHPDPSKLIWVAMVSMRDECNIDILAKIRLQYIIVADPVLISDQRFSRNHDAQQHERVGRFK
nr:hypothetical protein CFP56_53233 [Quercus suber]